MELQYPHRQKQLERLVQKLGIPKTATLEWKLLDLALTHPSLSTTANYEQLEFVGDAVVRLAASEFLLENYPELPVGEFAAIRSILVSDRILSQIAASYGLEQYLLVANSVLNDPEGLTSRLADSFEAVLAALYLPSHTLNLVRSWLDAHLQQLVIEIQQDPARQNYKAALQEWSQSLYKILPEYRVEDATPIHGNAQRFRAEVWLRGEKLGEGRGRSIKAAEQAAAQAAFQTITHHPYPKDEAE